MFSFEYPIFYLFFFVSPVPVDPSWRDLFEVLFPLSLKNPNSLPLRRWEKDAAILSILTTQLPNTSISRRGPENTLTKRLKF